MDTAAVVSSSLRKFSPSSRSRIAESVSKSSEVNNSAIKPFSYYPPYFAVVKAILQEGVICVTDVRIVSYSPLKDVEILSAIRKTLQYLQLMLGYLAHFLGRAFDWLIVLVLLVRS